MVKFLPIPAGLGQHALVAVTPSSAKPYEGVQRKYLVAPSSIHKAS